MSNLCSPEREKRELAEIKEKFTSCIVDGEKDLLDLYDSDDEMKQFISERLVNKNPLLFRKIEKMEESRTPPILSQTTRSQRVTTMLRRRTNSRKTTPVIRMMLDKGKRETRGTTRTMETLVRMPLKTEDKNRTNQLLMMTTSKFYWMVA